MKISIEGNPSIASCNLYQALVLQSHGQLLPRRTEPAITHEDHPVAELWQVIAGRTPGRKSDQQITLFDSVGFATEDFSPLRYVRD